MAYVNIFIVRYRMLCKHREWQSDDRYRRETRVTERTVFNFLSFNYIIALLFGIELCRPSDNLIVYIYIIITVLFTLYSLFIPD